jgi:hypothetical protein
MIPIIFTLVAFVAWALTLFQLNHNTSARARHLFDEDLRRAEFFCVVGGRQRGCGSALFNVALRSVQLVKRHMRSRL